MKVTFRQAGGFAGLSRGCDLDTAALPAAEAARLERLVSAARLEARSARGPEAARDLAAYAITIEGEGGALVASFDDATVPEEAEALLDYLRRRARPIPLP